MKRREFIAGLGSVAAWPAVALAQDDRMRHVGVLMAYEENDPEATDWLSGFRQGLEELGWVNGRNTQMEIRWAGASIDRMRMFARELVGLRPDVILGQATPATDALHHETQTIPIVFVAVSNPVAAGFVAGLPHPGGNITGFVYVEAGVAGKWLELLTQIAPSVKRIAIMFNPDTAPYATSYFLPSFEAASRSLNVESIAAPVRSDAEIEAVMASLGREPGGGLIIPGDIFTIVHREPIISLATRNNVPAIYQISAFVREGGLLSYGPFIRDIFYRSASYVDRILRGAKPADLPVQLPVKFEMTVNAKTAKALGLTIPQSILLRADEVIE